MWFLKLRLFNDAINHDRDVFNVRGLFDFQLRSHDKWPTDVLPVFSLWRSYKKSTLINDEPSSLWKHLTRNFHFLFSKVGSFIFWLKPWFCHLKTLFLDRLGFDQLLLFLKRVGVLADGKLDLKQNKKARHPWKIIFVHNSRQYWWINNIEIFIAHYRNRWFTG